MIIVLSFLLIGFVAFFPPMKALVSVSAAGNAPPPVDWRNGAGSGCSVQQTADKGYIMTGGEGANPNGCWLAKINESGSLEWKKTYANSGFESAGRAAERTTDGDYMLAGLVRDTQNSGAYPQALLIKADEFGNMKWNRTYEGEGNAVAFSGQQTSDGGYALAGWSSQVGVNDADFYLVKTDSDGNVEWNKTYGGNSNDVAWSLQQTSDGGYILAGETHSFGADYPDSWLVKTDSVGNMEWNKTYGSIWFETAYSVRQTTDGGYVFVGYENWDGGQGLTAKVAFIIKTDGSGTVEWKDGFGGEAPPTGRAWAEAYSVDETSDGGFIVTGDVSLSNGGRALFLMKTHSQGNGTDFQGMYVGYAGGRAVIQTTDGGYAVAGYFGLMKIMSENIVILARFRYSPATPIINESILLNASYSFDRNLDIVSYLWNFDDGNVTSVMNPIIVHRYENAGIYNVSLTVVDAEGLNSTYALVLCAKMPTVMTLSTSTPPISVGYSVRISGTLFDLSWNNVANESVGFYYAYGGYENWNLIGSNLTNHFGDFLFEWFPSAPSYYKIRAVYAGNYTHTECSKNVTLSMLPYGVAGMFIVESNSTVSSMGFDTSSQTLSFSVDGAEGSNGYAKVTLSKLWVPDSALMNVFVDDVECSYDVTDVDNSLVILFSYDHSVHLIKIQLNETIPEFMASMFLLLFMVATLLAAMFHRRLGRKIVR